MKSSQISPNTEDSGASATFAVCQERTLLVKYQTRIPRTTEERKVTEEVRRSSLVRVVEMTSTPGIPTCRNVLSR